MTRPGITCFDARKATTKAFQRVDEVSRLLVEAKQALQEAQEKEQQATRDYLARWTK